MAFNELEAMKMLDDGKITDKEIQLLSRVRDGVALAEVEDDNEFKELEKKGLVMRTPLSAPRARVTVDAVIPTEEGTTTLNLFDKRFRENIGTTVGADANTAPDVDPKLVKHPTDEEARKVPSLEKEPLSYDEKNKGYTPANQEEAMKDPVVAAGGRDINNAELSTETVLTDDAKVVVPKDAHVALDSDGNTKKAPEKRKA